MRVIQSCVILALAAGAWGAAPPSQPMRAEGKLLGEMKLWFFIALEPDKLVQAWDAPNRQQEPAVMEPSHQVPDMPFGLGFLFSNCSAGSDGRCKVTATYRILAPDGSLAVERTDLILWQGHPPPRDRRELGNCLWKTYAEATDPPGVYRFQAVVTDHVKHKRITLERTMELRAR